MIELNISDLQLISGGEFNWKDAIEPSIISTAALHYGDTVVNTKMPLGAAAATGPAAVASGILGWKAGSFLYNNSETVRETAIGMFESIHLRYGDQSGNDYGNYPTADGNSYGG